MDDATWEALAAALRDAGIAAASGSRPRAVSGGDISAAWRLDTADGVVFLKTGGTGDAGLLEAEREGLEALAAAAAVRVPRVLGHGIDAGVAWLALEWLTLARCDAAAERLLGEQLAALHRNTAARHGWHRDNWIGRTPQRNAWHEDWATFYAKNRLGYQLELAAQNGFGGELQALGAQVIERLPKWFADYRPEPSLLHGDLWSGNHGCCAGEPVIYDPAVSYGDRETDLAMTRLFGGFGATFYAAYEAAWPLAPGHETRDALYRLYHVLNHANLFGGGYASQAVALMRTLIG